MNIVHMFLARSKGNSHVLDVMKWTQGGVTTHHPNLLRQIHRLTLQFLVWLVHRERPFGKMGIWWLKHSDTCYKLGANGWKSLFLESEKDVYNFWLVVKWLVIYYLVGCFKNYSWFAATRRNCWSRENVKPKALICCKECWALLINICPCSFPITADVRGSHNLYLILVLEVWQESTVLSCNMKTRPDVII